MSDPATIVYFIQAATGGPIKIGSTNNLEKRLADLQTASPIELLVIGVCDPPFDGFEKWLHSTLVGYRIRGEWFEDDPGLRQVMQSYVRKAGS